MSVFYEDTMGRTGKKCIDQRLAHQIADHNRITLETIVFTEPNGRESPVTLKLILPSGFILLRTFCWWGNYLCRAALPSSASS